MKATAVELAATTRLRERCTSRGLAYKVARCAAGWRGCVFALDSAFHESFFATMPTRLELVERLIEQTAREWPLRRGRPARA